MVFVSMYRYIDTIGEMKKFALYFCLSVLFFLIIFFSLAYFKKNQIREEERNFYPQVSFYNDQGIKIASFKVEISSTSAQHKKGLMYRENLPKDEGMLFIFKQEQPLSFWMKNTLIYLDIIYISKDKKVVSVSVNTPPCKKDPCSGYPSKGNAMYVLEINGGLTEKFGIEKGTAVEFNLL